jgi:SOS-response transcriptional repressor LexA
MENLKKSTPSIYVTHAPLISQYAQAGYLRGFSDHEFMESQPVYYSTRKYNNGNYIAFEIRGDSMRDGTELSICDGDIVLCRELPVEYWKERIHTPKVFVIIHRSEGITCKEVTRHNLENGEITCHSWNPDPEYSDFKLNLAEVNQLFYLKEIARKTKY